MADFSQLEALAVTRETTREYIFTNIVGEPSIIVSPATDDNADFLAARLELALTDAPAVDDTKKPRKQSEKVKAQDLIKQYDDDREFDRKVLSRACARNWGTVPVDKAGEPVEFSEQNVYDFLKALPNYMLDPFRGFCGNIYNFAPRPTAPKGDQMGES